ncbi:MAG TPA: enoyl-CoA hydratase-related protein [Solirubrobacteraceae bacterium]|jgi:enoyl-CoA hydratase|nr:enoyl-CoA hydratase-related protein [Solirubrobacteraceae bacterium]
MPPATLLIDEAHPGIRVLTLNRPEKRNAIDRQLFSDLIDAFNELDRDEAVRVAIITGSGPAFCGGVDLTDVGDRELIEERRKTGVSPPGVLLTVQTPVIAAVNGACVAGGLELALACDVVIASAAASFADTHLQLGLIPSWGGAALLPAAVGTRRAKEMILSGRFITADEAYQYGLAAQVVSPDELLEAAVALAQRIAHAPPGQVQRLLEIYDGGEGLQRDERLELERRILLETQLDVSRADARRSELADQRATDLPA